MKKNFLKLIEKFQPLIKGSFFRAASVLAGGAALGQLLSVVALPFLTRLYSPEDFEIYAIFSSVLAFTSISAALRFDVAIPVAKDSLDANRLVLLACASSFFISFLFFAFVFFVSEFDFLGLGFGVLDNCIYFLPLAVLFTSISSALQFWALRKQNFKIVARAKISQSVGGLFSQLALSFLGGIGLVLGGLASTVFGFFSLLIFYIRSRDLALIKNDLNSFKITFSEYKKFPLFSTFEALSSSGGAQVPIVILAMYAVGPEVGYLALANRVMQAPISLIGGAVGQVFHSKAPEEFRQGRLDQFTTAVVRRLIQFGVGPILFVGIISPKIFPFVFGSEWERSGEIVVWLTPMFIFQLMVSPLSMAMHATGNQKLAFSMQLSGLIFRVGTVLVCAEMYRQYLVESYAISGAIFYVASFLLILKVSNVAVSEFFNVIRSTVSVVMMWLGAAVFLALSFDLIG